MPSAGNIDFLVSGGVCTGVMVSAPFLMGALDGALCEGAVACIVSFGGFADRGLSSLPGGEESELVKGVRACSDAVWPGYDMVPAAENTDEATLEADVSDRELVSKSLRRAPLSLGICVFFSCVVTSLLAINEPQCPQMSRENGRPGLRSADLPVALTCPRPRGTCRQYEAVYQRL